MTMAEKGSGSMDSGPMEGAPKESSPKESGPKEGGPQESGSKEKKGSRLRFVRPLVFLLILGGGGFAWWKYQHRSEGYRGGDVVTTGTIEAVHVQLGFQVAGRLAEMPVSEGSVVRAGEVVGRLDKEDLEVQVSSARGALEAARAALAQARANRGKAVRDLARMRELLKENATTQQQMDAARAAAEVASAQVAAGDAQVHQAESALAQAQLQLSYAVLRAPQSAQVSEKIHEPGEMVMLGTPVIALAEMDTVKVRAAVDETRVGAVRPGDKVRVRVYTFDQKVFEGEVTDVQPAGDFATRKDWGAQRRDIRTFTVTARVPNPEHLLKDGMTADVTIVVNSTVRSMAERQQR
jgi:RND family efflux transporter MFP subunit